MPRSQSLPISSMDSCSPSMAVFIRILFMFSSLLLSPYPRFSRISRSGP